MLKKIVWSVTMVATGAIIGGVTVVAASIDDPKPNTGVIQSGPCPTEDSCDLDYRDGQWYAYPTIP